MPSHTEIHVRPANSADTEIVAEFNRRLAWETEQKELPLDVVTAGVAGLIAQPTRGRYYIAESGGQIAGQLLITFEWSDWRNGEIWWLQSVYVPADHRGRGVFRTLFEAVRREAETTPGIVGLRLYVEEHNQAARGVYDRLGMRESGYLVLERMLGEA